MRRAAWVLIALAAPAFAGRPLTTEDAAVLDDKACQLEAWIDRSRDATTGWLVPACNFGGGVEWQVGGARTREGGEGRFSEAYAQAKGLLRAPRDESPWGVGLVLGVIRRPLAESNRGWQHPYALVPITFTLGDFRWHVQPGWARDRERRRNTTPWGIAGEYAATPCLSIVAEAFGENGERPYLRAGARWSVVRDRLDLDLTVVTRPGGTRDDRLASLGLTLILGKFLP